MLPPTRFLLLAGFFVFLSPFSANGTEEFANPPTPLPAKVVEQIAANLVDLIFLFERVATFTPLVATEYNGAGALVASRRAGEGMRRRIVRTRNLSGQARQILRKKRFPDLIMIWIGHNNLDWVEGLSPNEREHPEERLQEIATQFRQNYTEPLQELIDRAKTENHKVAIVVFGLANLDTFLKARRKAEALHARNPALYPYFESGNRSFESLKP